MSERIGVSSGSVGLVRVDGLGELSPVEADRLGRRLRSEALRAAKVSRLARDLVGQFGLSLEDAADLADQVLPIIKALRPRTRKMLDEPAPDFIRYVMSQIEMTVRSDDRRIKAIAALAPFTCDYLTKMLW